VEHVARTIDGTTQDSKRFPFVQRETVRFNDCDPLGHANNALYSTYIEQARLGLLEDFDSCILARVEIDFRSQLRAGDRIEIHTRCRKIGSTSFELEHEIHSQERLVAQALSVLVGYDYSRQATAPLSPALKARLQLQTVA
jgi:acyl-CoA thioester hydrolase